jgi:acetolactate decarboxylase
MKIGLLMLAMLLVAGCAQKQPSPWLETVTQVSTYEALQAGRYEGQLAISNLLTYGDTGLGTFEGLDGEMVVVSGTVYQVAHTGTVAPVPLDARTPFACVTWFEPDVRYDVGPMPRALFERTLQWKNPAPPQVLALRVQGVFKSISLRSVPRQSPPYAPLAGVVADQQQVWDRDEISGTMVGFYTPHALAGVAPEGFHLHFISTDATVGGHVLDFELQVGRIEVDVTPVAHYLLPPPEPKQP